MSTTTEQSAVRYEKDADGIVTLTLDDPTSSANTMNDLYRASINTAIDRLYDELAADESSIKGVVIASAKKTFFAGGNLKGMVTAGPEDAEDVFKMAEDVKAGLRSILAMLSMSGNGDGVAPPALTAEDDDPPAGLAPIRVSLKTTRRRRAANAGRKPRSKKA